MKSFFLLPLIFVCLQVAAQSETSITVSINNVPGDEGQVILSLHDESTFMKTDALQTKTSLIKDGKVTVTFENVAPGIYGIIGLHDKNKNGNIDMSSKGFPVEDYGISNNPLSMGPPQWSEAKFQVSDEPLDLEIRF